MYLRLLTAFVAVTLCSSSLVAQTTRTWALDELVTGTWSNPNNWRDTNNNPGVPVAGDDVVVAVMQFPDWGYTVFDAYYSLPLASLTLGGHAWLSQIDINSVMLTDYLEMPNGWYMLEGGAAHVTYATTVGEGPGLLSVSGGGLTTQVLDILGDSGSVSVSGDGDIFATTTTISPLGWLGISENGGFETSLLTCEGLYGQSGGYVSIGSEFVIRQGAYGVGSATVSGGTLSAYLTLRLTGTNASFTQTGGYVFAPLTHVSTDEGALTVSGGDFNAGSLYVGTGPIGSTYGGCGTFTQAGGSVAAEYVHVSAPPAAPNPAKLIISGTSSQSFQAIQMSLGSPTEPTHRGDLHLSNSNATVSVSNALHFYAGGGVAASSAVAIEMGPSAAFFNDHSSTSGGGLDDVLMSGWEHVTLRFTQGYNPSSAAIYEAKGYNSGLSLSTTNGRWVENPSDGLNHYILDGLVLGATGPGQLRKAYINLSYGGGALYVNTLTVVSARIANFNPGLTYYLNGGSPKQFIMGDANLDGFVGDNDLSLALSNWGQGGKLWSIGDITGDTNIDSDDMSLILANWTGDGLMGGGDEEMLASTFDQSGLGKWKGAGAADTDELRLLLADWQPSGDLQADFADLGRILSDWNGSGAATVPEPTLVSLLLVGGLSLIRRRGR